MSSESIVSQPVAAIFDMDGVLADTVGEHYESWRRVGERMGVEIEWQTFRRTFGRPNHQTVHELFGRRLSPEEVRRIDREKEAEFRRIVAERGLKPLPGAAELARALKNAGFGLAVGSSGPRENVDAILSALGISDCFGAIVSAWDVERGKPDPEVFLKAAAGLGVEPRRCVVIEDMPVGIEAAHRAGMKCVAVVSTCGPDELTAADLVVRSLKELSPRRLLALVEAREAQPAG